MKYRHNKIHSMRKTVDEINIYYKFILTFIIGKIRQNIH